MDIMALEETSLHQRSGYACRERELVDMARSGDREAFGELVRRQGAEALGLAGSLTKDGQGSLKGKFLREKLTPGGFTV